MIGQLAANYPGSVFDSIPRGTFNYGGGGVNEWGSICGCPNAASAVLFQIMGNTGPEPYRNELLHWYESTALPSNAAYEDYKSSTWVPFGPAPIDSAPKTTAKSLLCHASYSKWMNTANKDVPFWTQASALYGANQNKDRCAKLCYDTAYKLATIINNWMAHIPAGEEFDTSVMATGCMNSNCHADGLNATLRTKGKMQCTEACHQ